MIKKATFNERINFIILVSALLFLLACFFKGNFIFLYPGIIFILAFINFDWAMQFLFFTLGINFIIFSDGLNLGSFHPNSFITLGQIIFLIIGIIKLKKFYLDDKTKILFIFTIISLASLAYSPDVINGIKLLANILLYPLILLVFYNKADISAEKIFKLNIFSGVISWLFIYPLQLLILKLPLFVYHTDRGWRFGGAGLHPVPMAFFMVLVFYSALFMYDKHKQKRYLIVALISVILVFLTYTRIALVGLFLTMLIYLYYRHKLKFAIPLMLVGLLLAYQNLLNFFLKKSALYYQPNIAYVSGGRTLLWELSLQSFAKYPIAGSGLGSSTTILKSTNLVVPHNDFIRVLLETGLLGVLPFIVYIYKQLLSLIKRFRTHNIILCLFFFFIIASITDNLFDYNLYFTFSLFALLGIANRPLKIIRSAERREK